MQTKEVQLANLLSNLPTDIIQSLSANQVYLVGGAIRDLLHKDTNPQLQITDFDFVVFGIQALKDFSQKLADVSGSSFIELDPENQSYRIVNKSWQIDIVAPRGKNIEQDLEARDITVNAIAFDLQSKKLIDPLKGIQDLKNKIIKGISEQNFADDPLRCLRVFRVAAQLSDKDTEFNVDTETLNWIKSSINGLSKVAPERISYEIWLLMNSNVSFKYLWMCIETRLWEKIFPEFIELRKVPANTHHHLPLIEHTFELIKQYEQNVKNKLPQKCLKFIEDGSVSSVSYESIVKMSCLLHDISKPETWQIDGEKHSFHKHEKIGSEVTKEIGNRMKWSNNIVTTVSKLVYFHLRPFQLSQKGQEPTEKALRKFFRQTSDIFYPLMALAWADLLSTRGPKITEEGIASNEVMLAKLCEKYEEFMEQEQKAPLLLKGDELEEAIKKANLPQTKIIKELLTELRDLQLNGEVTNKEQALEWFIDKGKSINEQERS